MTAEQTGGTTAWSGLRVTSWQRGRAGYECWRHAVHRRGPDRGRGAGRARPGPHTGGHRPRRTDAATLGGAARALAHRLRPQHVPGLPADVEIEVVTATGVETFHYRLSDDLVELDTVPAPGAVVRVTLQKPVHLVLMANGVSLMTVIASGRASLVGALEDVLGVFGEADFAPRPGRRTFTDLSRLLLDCRPVRAREVARILDRFGRRGLAKELVHFFRGGAAVRGSGRAAAGDHPVRHRRHRVPLPDRSRGLLGGPGRRRLRSHPGGPEDGDHDRPARSAASVTWTRSSRAACSSPDPPWTT